MSLKDTQNLSASSFSKDLHQEHSNVQGCKV